MQSLKDILQRSIPLQQLHHTYIFVGPHPHIRDALLEFVRTSFNLPPTYPDIWIQEYQSIGVDDAEEIASVHMRRAIGENKKFIVFFASNITQQAQNSLLKLLEEPAVGTHFFIILPTVASLLPTILSRSHVVALNNDTSTYSIDPAVAQSVAQFVSQSPSSRIEAIGQLLNKYEKDEITREDIYSFVNNVEQYVHDRLMPEYSKDTLPKMQQSFEVLALVQTYIRDTSSSLKILLEYLALRLPKL